MIAVAAIQMSSGRDVQANLAVAERLLQKAAEDGATLAVLPENFALMPASQEERLRHAEREAKGPIQDMLAAVSRRYGLWVVGGTVCLQAQTPGKVRAACLVFDDHGEQVGRYDKMHLFDVDLGDNERYQESLAFECGEAPTAVGAPFGCLGLSVCYDLRFPELFRRLVEKGATLLTVPAAFTVPTGRAHWEPLLRARAIENGCYVIAAAQSGQHANGRATYGHSMVIDPWGTVIAATGDGEAVVVAPYEHAYLEKVRAQIPSLRHRRL